MASGAGLEQVGLNSNCAIGMVGPWISEVRDSHPYIFISLPEIYSASAQIAAVAVVTVTGH
jgi:hypothetical protein